VCPWYIQYLDAAKVKDLADQGTTPSLARAWSRISSWTGGSGSSTALPINLARGFDHVLLHEMTHAIPLAATIDAAGPGKAESYGWDNCVRFSSNGGTLNADNYAYFGLGTRIISPTNGAAAQLPMLDGSIPVLPADSASKKRRGDLHPVRGRGVGASSISGPSTFTTST
jgi:hypothetical protein